MPAVSIVVSYDASTGKFDVSGAINDKIFAYGLLEVAKDAIRQRIDKQNEALIEPAKGLFLPGNLS